MTIWPEIAGLLATIEAIHSVRLDAPSQQIPSDYHALAFALEQAQRENAKLEDLLVRAWLENRELREQLEKTGDQDGTVQHDPRL